MIESVVRSRPVFSCVSWGMFTCVGTFGGRYLGVECGAEWRFIQLQLQLQLFL